MLFLVGEPPSSLRQIAVKSNSKAGGSAIVYFSKDAKLALKEYRDLNKSTADPSRCLSLIRKSEELIKDAQNGLFFSKNFAWPVERIWKFENSKSHKFIGFTMHNIDVADYTSLEIVHHKVDSKIRRVSTSDDYKFKIAINLSQTISKLHKFSVFIVDISNLNFLIHKSNSNIICLDVDGYAFSYLGKKFNSEFATDEIACPEYHSNSLKVNQLGEFQDRFGLAVQIFRLDEFTNQVQRG